MRKLVLVLLLSLFLVDVSGAQPLVAPNPDGVEAPAATTGDEAATPEEGAPEEAAPTVNDIIEEVGEIPGAVEAIKAAKGDRTAMFIAISALISVVLNILLSVLQLLPVTLFKNGTAIRITCLSLGLLVYLTAQFGAGVEWYNALLLGLGGPGAILVNEISKLVIKKKQE